MRLCQARHQGAAGAVDDVGIGAAGQRCVTRQHLLNAVALDSDMAGERNLAGTIQHANVGEHDGAHDDVPPYLALIIGSLPKKKPALFIVSNALAGALVNQTYYNNQATILLRSR